jgi:hypothetical protein
METSVRAVAFESWFVWKANTEYVSHPVDGQCESVRSESDTEIYTNDKSWRVHNLV